MKKLKYRHVIASLAIIFVVANFWNTKNVWQRDHHRKAIFDLVNIEPQIYANIQKNVTYSIFGGWQVTKFKDEEILAYSAFYDDRDDIGPVSVIQILVVSTTTKDITCHIWYEGNHVPYASPAVATASGRTDHIFGAKTYGQYFLTCKLKKTLPIPKEVSFTISEQDISTVTTLLPIIHSQKSNWSVEFGVCVTNLRGDLPKDRVIEWIEINKLLGVGEFNLYNGTLTSNLRPVFDSYIKEGLLSVRTMPPPVNSWNSDGTELGSPASLNDCMLRNMYRYRYILVIDTDEIIVPRNAKNYHEMLKEINKELKLKNDPPVYTFRNVFFFYDFGGDARQPKTVHSLRYRTRNAPGEILYTPKSFIDPRRCLSVFNHYCYVQFSKWREYYYFDVGTKAGLKHHYKNCKKSYEKSECDQFFKEKTSDDIMLRYKKWLMHNIKKRYALLRTSSKLIKK